MMLDGFRFIDNRNQPAMGSPEIPLFKIRFCYYRVPNVPEIS